MKTFFSELKESKDLKNNTEAVTHPGTSTQIVAHLQTRTSQLFPTELPVLANRFSQIELKSAVLILKLLSINDQLQHYWNTEPVEIFLFGSVQEIQIYIVYISFTSEWNSYCTG